MTRTIFIGVDDTDAPGNPGTGRVSRELGEHLERLGLGKTLGITRHQLLVHPSIPYTSHNSASCLALASSADITQIALTCAAFVRAWSAAGSDPAVCVVERKAVTKATECFGRAAQSRVIAPDEAYGLARDEHLRLESLAGTLQGGIGALAAVGLRATGNDGRFVDLRGIREVAGVISVSELLRGTDVATVVDADQNALSGDELLDSMDWIRPNLIRSKPVLRVKRSGGRSPLWLPIERKHDDVPAKD